MNPLLDHITVVLYEPQDDINIGTAIRACKNFGVSSIRLVRPAHADPRVIQVSAPKAEDLIDSLGHFDSLPDALADCPLVLGMTARHRKHTRIYGEPRGAAADLVAYAAQGRVALLFGREDSGLPTDALDCCQGVVTIPTNPDYSSLNLGQAVLLMLWETFRQATDAPITPIAPPPRPSIAPHQAIERLVSHSENALETVGFLKPSTHDHMLGVLREMFHRFTLDQREVAIWHGIFSQIEWAVGKKGKS